jgi:hypothetical protein
LTLELGDLRLEADHEPPVEVVDALRDHKEAVVAVLGKNAELVADWHRLLEDDVAAVVRARSLTRPEAECIAFQIVRVEFPDTPSNLCARCDWAETQSNILLSIGISIRKS